MKRGTHLREKDIGLPHEAGGPGYGCRLLPRTRKAQERWEDPDYWISEWEYLEKHGRFPRGERQPEKSEFDTEMPARTHCGRLCPLWKPYKYKNHAEPAPCYHR